MAVDFNLLKEILKLSDSEVRELESFADISWHNLKSLSLLQKIEFARQQWEFDIHWEQEKIDQALRSVQRRQRKILKRQAQIAKLTELLDSVTIMDQAGESS